MTNLKEQFEERFKVVPVELTPEQLLQAKAWYLGGVISTLVCLKEGSHPIALIEEAQKLADGTQAEADYVKAINEGYDSN